MLVEFKVRNFLSIKEEAIFSMLTSCKNNEKNMEYLIPFDESKNEYLLKTALIYGANASGKTNFLKALGFLFYQIMTSKDKSTSKDINCRPFEFDENTRNEPGFFEIRFIKNNVLYIYGLELDSKTIHKEYLYKTPENQFNKKATKVFSRTNDNEQNLKSTSKLKKKYLIESAHNRLYLSVAGFWQDPNVLDAYKWVEENVKMFIPSLLSSDGGLSGYTSRKLKKEKLNNDSPFLEKVTSIFKKLDTGISKFDVKMKKLTDKEIEIEIPNDFFKFFTDEAKNSFLESLKIDPGTEIKTIHKVNNIDYELDIYEESVGTQKAFDLIGVLVDTIEQEGLLIIDEIENSLHPELTREILKHFQEMNCKAQILFTTHATSLMSLDYMRKEQFWFAEKNPQTQDTILFSLEDVTGVRNNENIESKYLAGRYGAFPYINIEDGLCPK